MVAIVPPVPEVLSGVSEADEHVLVEALVAELAIEARGRCRPVAARSS